MKSNKVEVFLEISGFEDVSHTDITQLLGLEPNRVYVKGQPRNPQGGSLARTNRWLLYGYSPERPRLLFEDQVDALISLVMPRLTAFQALCHRYTCVLRCGVMSYCENGESTPAVHLERRHVELLEALTADFDVDIYCH